jgi:hypothetical protein
VLGDTVSQTDGKKQNARSKEGEKRETNGFEREYRNRLKKRRKEDNELYNSRGRFTERL